MKKLYTSIAFLLLISSISAQNYYTSPLWGEEGHREYAPWSGSAAAYDGVLRSDGKLLVAGTGYWSQCNCFRVTMAVVDTTCGAPDPSFGNNGTLSFQYEGRSTCQDVLIQDDGKIVACGITAPGNGFSGHKPAIYRRLSNGDPDSTFNGNGSRKQSFDATSAGAFWQAFTLPNGRITCVGASSSNINGGVNGVGAMRFNADGSMDNTFSGDGIARLNLSGTGYSNDFDLGTGLMLPNGSVLAIGLFTTVGTQYVGMVKIDSTGTIDTGFGVNGLNVSPVIAASDVDEGGLGSALLPSGKILVSGTGNFTNGEFFMARFNSNGDVDSTYATNGVSIVPIAANALGRRMELLPDGSTLQFGSQNWNSGHPRIVKRLADGSLDMSFGTNGIAAPAGPISKKMYGGMSLPGAKIIAWGLQGQISIFKFTTDPTSEGIIDLGADVIGCNGDSVMLDAGAGYETYLWSTTDSVQSIYTSTDGEYIVSVTNNLECADSDTVNVVFMQGPDTAIVTSVNGIDLETTATGDLQWYFDGVLIIGATQSTYSATANGEYTVMVTDMNGCSSISDAFSVTSVGIEELTRSPWMIAPNPVQNDLFLSGPAINSNVEYTIHSMDGRVVLQKISTSNRIFIDDLPNGVYILKMNVDEQEYLLRFVKI